MRKDLHTRTHRERVIQTSPFQRRVRKWTVPGEEISKVSYSGINWKGLKVK